jgi:propanediol dehydratase large subunit
MFWRLEDRIVKLEVFTQNVAWRMGPCEVKEALGPMNLCRVLFALQTLDRERSRKISKKQERVTNTSRHVQDIFAKRRVGRHTSK